MALRLFFALSLAAGLCGAEVTMSEEKIVLPTYETEAPDKIPLFYRPEEVQLAEKHVYPYPLTVGYTGHLWDPALRQYFAPFRHFNPKTARWNMPDPLGMVDGPNVYQDFPQKITVRQRKSLN